MTFLSFALCCYVYNATIIVRVCVEFVLDMERNLERRRLAPTIARLTCDGRKRRAQRPSVDYHIHLALNDCLLRLHFE